MFYATLSGFTDLHRAAQIGDEQQIAKLLQEASLGPLKYSKFLTPLPFVVDCIINYLLILLSGLGFPCRMLICWPVIQRAVRRSTMP